MILIRASSRAYPKPLNPPGPLPGLATPVPSPLIPAMRLTLPACLVPAVLLLAGCASPTDQLRPVPVAGGHVIGIAFGPRGPLPGKADGYTVLGAISQPSPQGHQIIYQFAFSAPPGAALKRVQVDDISDEKSSPLIDDTHPWLSDNVWHMETSPMASDDPRLSWIFTVTPSMRVYRFTLTDQAGHTTIMHQLTGYPDFIKAVIRSKWGEKY